MMLKGAHRARNPLARRLMLTLTATAATLFAGAAWSDAPSGDNGRGKYMRFSHPSALRVPVPFWSTGAMPIAPVLPGQQYYTNPRGVLGITQDIGTVFPRNNAFFQSLGSNGRTCATCHQPSDAMSLNTSTIAQRWNLTRGRDPLFAPVDGADCPSRSGTPSAHSLLINRGLFRVFLPVPKTTSDLSAFGGEAAHPTEFTISVVHDPNGCNTDPKYARQVDPVTGEVSQMVSVYRRPRMSANLRFMTTPGLTLLGKGALPNIDMVTGAPVVDASGNFISGNIMWDGREPSLESQAINATLGHAQAKNPPTAQQVAEIVAYENSVFAAQVADRWAGLLTPTVGSQVSGGSRYLSEQSVGFGNFSVYDAWSGSPVARRASIARGQALFNTRRFVIGNVAGLNNAAVLNVPNPTTTTCSSCHGGLHAGGEPFAAGQRDIGTGGHAATLGGGEPVKWLPIFKVTCRAPYKTAFLGSEVLTNDPGLALITGRCADVGRKSVPQIRGLAARAPYFSDGSAKTLREVVQFYDRRFSMGLTADEIEDMVNFLDAM